MTTSKTSTSALKVSRTRKAMPPAKAPTAPAVEPASASEPAPRPPAPTGKLAILTGLLQRPQGARLADMTAATGWQAHSVRGALAGALKKKHGLAITSEKDEGGRTYRAAAAS